MKSKIYPFYILLILYLLKPVYDWPENIFQFSVTPAYNIFVLFIVVYIIFIKRFYITKNFINASLLFSFAISLLIGVSKSKFNLQFLSHIYFYLMPVFMISYGCQLGTNYYSNFVNITQKISTKLFYFLLLLAICYIFIHAAGYWEYFGYSTGLLVCFSLMHKKNNKLKVVSFLSDLFSGKRTPLVVWILLIILENKRLIFIFPLLLIAFGSVLYDYLPLRFLSVIDLDIFDPKSLYMATGGRSAEWSSIAELNDNNYFQWIFGNGFGITYKSVDEFFDSGGEIRHYSHLMPLSYILISGFVSFLLIYIPLFLIVLRAYILKINFYLYLIIIFLYSFAGASLHVEPIPWIFLGMSIVQIKKYRRKHNV